MKRNLLQILTLCLCIVLLVITVMQGKKLDEYRMQMENKLQDMENTLHHDIQNISWTIERELEEAARVIENYTFKPTGIDSDNHALQADVSVILKQWYEDTEVILLAEVGGNQQNIPMMETEDLPRKSRCPWRENWKLFWTHRSPAGD